MITEVAIENLTSYIEETTELAQYVESDDTINSMDLSSTMKFFYVFLPAFGIPGNIFATAVMLSSQQMRRKPSNLFMIHQSIVDLIACICTLATTYIDSVILSKKPSLLESLFCRIFLSAGITCLQLSRSVSII